MVRSWRVLVQLGRWVRGDVPQLGRGLWVTMGTLAVLLLLSGGQTSRVVAQAEDPEPIPDYIPNVTLERYVEAFIEPFTEATAFFGMGRYRLEPGQTVQTHSHNGWEILVGETGALSILAGGPTDLWPLGADGHRRTKEVAPTGQAFRLNPTVQLVIPPNTTHTIRNDGSETATAYVVAILHQTDLELPPRQVIFGWTPQTGQPQEIWSSGVASISVGKAFVTLERAIMQPGGFVPPHTHPGIEAIYIEEGVFSGITGSRCEMHLYEVRPSIGTPRPGGVVGFPAGNAAFAYPGAVNGGGNGMTEGVTKVWSLIVTSVEQAPSFRLIDGWVYTCR